MEIATCGQAQRSARPPGARNTPAADRSQPWIPRQPALPTIRYFHPRRLFRGWRCRRTVSARPVPQSWMWAAEDHTRAATRSSDSKSKWPSPTPPLHSRVSASQPWFIKKNQVRKSCLLFTVTRVPIVLVWKFLFRADVLLSESDSLRS